MSTLNNVNMNTVLASAVSGAINPNGDKPMGTLRSTDITVSTQNAVTMAVSATLVREELATPQQALTLAVIFAEHVERLVTSGNKWERRILGEMEDVTFNGMPMEGVETFDPIAVLIAGGLIDTLGNRYFATEKVHSILEMEKKGRAPFKLKEGVTRLRNYCKSGATSPLFEEAIHALEATAYMANTYMLDIATEVYKLAPQHQKDFIMKQDYVLKGTRLMEEGEAYISEFFGDTRARMYQANCYGPNGQSSDMARAMMLLHGVSTNYVVEDAFALLLDEVRDMGSWADDDALFKDISSASKQPAQFILKHLDKGFNIKKPWSFVSFSKVLTELIAYDGTGEKPYIGLALGYDAKCSGPQYGALMVADENMCEATGFTTQLVDDAYIRALTSCYKAGLPLLTRAGIKKAFMAIFYGASKDAMSSLKVIENIDGIYDTLFSGKSVEQVKAISQLFHGCIVKSFGAKLNNLRSKIKQGGYDYEGEITKFDRPVKYFMPDGFEVSMDYKMKLDIEGNIVTGNTISKSIVETGNIAKVFQNMTFKLKEDDLPNYARTGFVNMIQATDALIARLIVAYLKKLGAQHIIGIHDCFRVNIHDMGLLRQAIKLAYTEVFGSDENHTTDYLTHGMDIIALYFQGAARSTKKEYEPARGSQFFGKDEYRRLDSVKGVEIQDLIDDLGNTTYFAK